MAAAAGTYAVGRRHGRGFFRDGWGRKLMRPEVFYGLEEAYGRWGTAGIFLSRFLPGLRAAVPPFAGVAGLSAARALVPAAVASAIWYAFLAFAGYQVADNWDAVKALVAGTNRALGIAALVLAVIAFVWLRRRSRRPSR
jgi:membrane protein DedA with SNARE-associated domain